MTTARHPEKFSAPGVLAALAALAFLAGGPAPHADPETPSFRVDYCIERCKNGRIHSVAITPDEFVVIVDPDRCGGRAYCPTSYSSIAVDEDVPLRTTGYTPRVNLADPFTVYVPRRFKTLYFYGIGGDDRSASVDLRQYEVRAGLADPAAAASAAAGSASRPPPAPPRTTGEAADEAGDGQRSALSIAAVVIGVEGYRYAPQARFAAADARAFADMLVEGRGIDPGNVLLRVDDEATRGEMMMALAPAGWLGRGAGPGTHLVVYFSGHGAFDVATGEPVLLPQDIDPEFPSGGYPLADLVADLAGMHAASVTLVLDTAFNGDTRDGGKLVPGRVAKGSLGRLRVPDGMRVFTAAAEGEANVASTERGHGLFTWYVLQGIGGAADAGDDGLLAADELLAFLDRWVPARAADLGRKQHPALLGDGAAALPFGASASER